MLVEKLRSFIDALFPNQLALSLRRELDAERERFRDVDARGGIVFETVSTMYKERIADLKAQVEDVEKERDYFRGRAERLELRLIPDGPRKDPRDPNIAGETIPRGKRTWRQVQADHAKKLQEEAEEEAKREAAKEKRPDAPKPLDAATKGTEVRPEPKPIDPGIAGTGSAKSA